MLLHFLAMSCDGKGDHVPRFFFRRAPIPLSPNEPIDISDIEGTPSLRYRLVRGVLTGLRCWSWKQSILEKELIHLMVTTCGLALCFAFKVPLLTLSFKGIYILTAHPHVDIRFKDGNFVIMSTFLVHSSKGIGFEGKPL